MAGGKLLIPQLQYCFSGCVHLLFTVYGFAYMTSFQNKEKKMHEDIPTAASISSFDTDIISK